MRGTYAGAAPADIEKLMPHLDGGALSGVIGYYLNGLVAAHPEVKDVLDKELNPAGQALLDSTRNECVVETLLRHGGRGSSTYTRGGHPLFPDVIMGDPVTRELVAAQKIGNRTPNAPVLLTTGNNDDIVPAAGVRELAASWCGKGVAVQLSETATPTLLPGSSAGHIVNAVTFAATDAYVWLHGRLTGKPAPTNCR